MKKFLLIGTWIPLLISCDGGSIVKDAPTSFTYTDVTGDSITIPYEVEAMSIHLTALSSISYNLYQNVNQHYISYQEANRLIMDYNHRFGQAHGSKNIAGCIPKSFIDGLPEPAADRVSGIVYFFCYDKMVDADPLDDQIQIAYVAVDDFDYSLDYFSHIADDKVFTYSTEPAAYKFPAGSGPYSVVDTAGITSYLTGSYAWSGVTAATAPCSTVRALNSEFRRFITGCENPLDGSSVDCTRDSYGFFEKGALQNLASQSSHGASPKAAVALRFYLAYDAYLNSNKIRLVVMGATDEGNILYVNGGSGNVYGNYIERSWP